MNKLCNSCGEAIGDVPDGATIMFGGWGATGGFVNAGKKM